MVIKDTFSEGPNEYGLGDDGEAYLHTEEDEWRKVHGQTGEAIKRVFEQRKSQRKES